jgi:hypothetical protein
VRDGHKEAAKELMATFRLLVATSISFFVLFFSLHTQGILKPADPGLFNAGLICALASSFLSGWLFLIVVGMLHRETEGIAYQPSVQVFGGSALITFIAAIALLVAGQWPRAEAASHPPELAVVVPAD